MTHIISKNIHGIRKYRVILFIKAQVITFLCVIIFGQSLENLLNVTFVLPNNIPTENFM